MMTSSEIRRKFLDFFQSKGHTIVPSAPIVVKNDPTLMFTNAGMNQFKDYFLGNKQAPYLRAADTQKCLRVSGKHNDLEEVGVDTYHHTMFEMLGNWSFGDYFKKEAIAWSWELLTEVYQIPKDRLYVTVFEGDDKEGLPASTIALAEWKKYVAPDRILLGNKKDNFWEMGDTGPCGPCSEIHVDCRSDEERAAVPGASLVNADHPQVIEIWNNVFMQYNRKKDGSLEPLPATHVDTGMGFERLVRVLQQKQSNYDTDVFMPTIRLVETLSQKTYDGSDSKQAVAFRVLADHIRAISFTIADGQLPSNTGAGYVIRRILRRAVRYYYSYLEVKEPLLFQLLPLLAAQFQEVFPELQQQLSFVQKVVREEEEAFLRTLDKGLKKIEDIIAQSKGGVIAGAAAFELYDTYGFPIDLTRLIARENNLQVDEVAFEKEMLQQKERSRAATAIDTEDWIELSTDNALPFNGYQELTAVTEVLKYRKVTAKGKTQFQLVLKQTPFYAESGGQVGDTGTLTFADQVVTVTDTRKENDTFIHFIADLPRTVSGDVTAIVDAERRGNIAAHHSATHLLHAALRQVLGAHVAQKGSLVNAQQLRFDFSHFAKMTPEEIQQVEAIVNEKIRQNIPVVIKQMGKEEATQMGAMALFGEKYGDVVRVVIIDPNYSIELCGGTHVGATGQLGLFKLKSESAVAAGVRRVEAVTGAAALQLVDEQQQVLQQIHQQLKQPKDAVKQIELLQIENSELKKKIERFEQQALQQLANQLATKSKQVGSWKWLGEIVDAPHTDGLKKLAVDCLKADQLDVVVLGAAIEGKAAVVVGLSETIQQANGWEAPKLIKEYVAPLIKGGGGGQKQLANAGGQLPDQLPAAIAAIEQLLR